MNTHDVSIIIPVCNKWDLTAPCLESLARYTPHQSEVIVVDNGSTDMTPEACPALGKSLFGESFLYVRQDENRNFAPACNIGARTASRNLLFFLNNDTLLTENWLPPLLAVLEAEPYPAAVGPLLLYPNFAGKQDRIQHLGIVFEPRFYPSHLYEGFPANHPACKKRRRYQALTGAALLIPKTRFMEAGLFDERFINGGEDIALGLRLSSTGHILTCVPDSKIYHLASQTPGVHTHTANNAKLLKENYLQHIVPDLHFSAAKDGYQLALTPGLKVYLELPQRRRELFAKQIARAASTEELETLLEREPLYHDAYPQLASLYEKKGNIRAAVDALFLAIKLRPHPETAHALTRLAKTDGHEKEHAYAQSICSWYQNATNFQPLCDAAESVAELAEKLNFHDVRDLYRQWTLQKDAMRRSFGCLPAQTPESARG